MKNLEREKRKLEWKKLNVLAREKIKEERLLFLKQEDAMLWQSKIELLRDERTVKEQMAKTVKKLKGQDFRNKAVIKMAQEAAPDINVEDMFKTKKADKEKEDF